MMRCVGDLMRSLSYRIPFAALDRTITARHRSVRPLRSSEEVGSASASPDARAIDYERFRG
jgi:hypothetical protein